MSGGFAKASGRFWLLILIVAAAQGQSARTIVWDVPEMGILPSDKIAIVKLAGQIGMELGRVGVLHIRPTGGRRILLQSVVHVEDKNRSWFEIQVCREDWQQCNYGTSEPVIQVGRWFARKEMLDRRETWKVQDGSWTADIAIEPGISFADTEQIVLAIRHKQLVNRLPASNREVIDLHVDNIAYVSRVRGERNIYQITTGLAAGEMIRVRVVANRVELIEYSSYIV